MVESVVIQLKEIKPTEQVDCVVKEQQKMYF